MAGAQGRHRGHGEVGTDNAIAWGVTPFLVGDAVKMLAAGLLTPLAWRGLERFRR